MLAGTPPWATFEVQIDPSAAQSAYEAVAPRLRDLPAGGLAVLRGDLQVAAAFALAVARFIERPAIRSRFARLAKTGEHDAACSAGLADVALAAWHVRHRLLLTIAPPARADLPVSLLDEAIALRGSLLAVAHQWASTDDAEALAAIRSCASCEDLACDLLALGALCDRRQAALESREPRYHAGDAARARDIGDALLRRLGAALPRESTGWAAMQPRAWTLLLRTYDEVRRAGRFLFPGAEGEARFPPLVTVARAGTALSLRAADFPSDLDDARM